MLDASSWTNPALAEDVDFDMFVTGTDAHIIVEMLIASGGQPVTVPMEGVGPPFPDVDGNGMVGLGDWERVCNVLNLAGNPYVGYPPPGYSPPANPPSGPPPQPGTNTTPPGILVTSFPASVSEMQVFTISGTFTMSYYLIVGSLGGDFRVTSGNFQGSGSGNWSVTGYFMDDNGSGTASDVRTLKFEVGNNLSPAIKGTASINITVNNVNPSAQVASQGSFNEGSLATIDITMLDASNAYGVVADSYTLVVDWGDGQTQTIQTSQPVVPATQWNWTIVPPPPAGPPVPPSFPHRLDGDGHITGITVSGMFSDRGVLDEHKLTIEFPDGQNYVEYFGPGPHIFTYTRNVSSLQAMFPIIARVRDDDSAEGYYTVFQSLPIVDLDVDSDNDNKLNLPEENSEEDGIEASATLPGKIILANVLDHTANGIPDYADGYNNVFGNAGNNRSQNFAQLVLKVPATIDPQVARVRFNYNAADPSSVVRETVAPDPAEADYAPGTSGSFRIWTRNGAQSRLAEPVNAATPGHFVPPSQAIRVNAIASGSQSFARTVLYVEGVNARDHQAITVQLDVDGDGSFEATDKVYVTIADLHIVFTDVTGIRELGGSTLQTVPRIPPDVEPDGVAADWMEGVEDGSILLMRVVGSKSLQQLPSGLQIAFGMIDASSLFASLPANAGGPGREGAYHAIDAGWAVNIDGMTGKLHDLGLADIGEEFRDNQHLVFGATFYRPPVEFDTAAREANTNLLRKISLAVRVTGDVETTASKARAIKLVRPPVVLVHGINSDPSTWDTLSANLDANGYRSKWFKVDHSGDDPQTPQVDPTFGNGDITQMWSMVAQKVADATASFRTGAARIQLADEPPGDEEFVFPWPSGDDGYRIAVQKVDVVAHSYGGLLTRWYLEESGAYNARRDVRKVTTLGTPHKGAPLANMLAEVYKDGLIANAHATGIAELGQGILKEEVVKLENRADDPIHTALPINGGPGTVRPGGLRPSYEVLAVGGARLGQLAANPFQDDVAYGAIIGTRVELDVVQYGIPLEVNLYHAFKPLVGSTDFDDGPDDVDAFPWFYYLNSGVNDTDGICPKWSAELADIPGSNSYIEVNHLQLPSSQQVIDQVKNWLNATRPLGSAQRTAYDPKIPASFANAYVGSTVNPATGASSGAGLKRDAIIKVELNPADTSAWYGTAPDSTNPFTLGGNAFQDAASLGPKTVALTGMVQLRSLGNVSAKIVADSTVTPDIVLDNLGTVQGPDMGTINPDGTTKYRDDTGFNDWITFRIETGRIGRNQNQLMGPDGTGWGHGALHYEISVNDARAVAGFEQMPGVPAAAQGPSLQSSPYFYYEVIPYTLRAPWKSTTNGLSLALYGAALARGTVPAPAPPASQINTVQLWDVDDATSDSADDLLDSRSITIAHPPGAWDGLLIPYQTTVLLVMASGEVQGNQGTSGEASAQVYQYLVEPTPFTWDLSSIANPIDVP